MAVRRLLVEWITRSRSVYRSTDSTRAHASPLGLGSPETRSTIHPQGSHRYRKFSAFCSAHGLITPPQIASLALSPNGHFLLSYAFDSTCIIHDVRPFSADPTRVYRTLIVCPKVIFRYTS